MRQKKPSAEAIMESENKNVDIIVADSCEVERYLKMVDFSEPLGTQEEKAIYFHIRETLTKSLNKKSQSDVVFAALIERIARTAVLLNRMEHVFLRMDILVTPMYNKKGGKSDYFLLQQEHRKCLETFANLRFAEGRKNETKVVEDLRIRVSREE